MRTSSPAVSEAADPRRSAVVRFPAEVDRDSASGAREKALVLLNRGVTGLVLDFSATFFCDSSGINGVFRIDQRARATGASLRLAVRPGSQVRRTFDLVGMDRLVPVLPTLAAAIDDLYRGRSRPGTGQRAERLRRVRLAPGGPAPTR